MITITLSIICILAGIFIVVRTYLNYQETLRSQEKEQRRKVLWEAYSPLIQESIFKGKPGEWKDIWREYDRHAKYVGNEKELPPNGQFALAKTSVGNESQRATNKVSHRLTA